MKKVYVLFELISLKYYSGGYRYRPEYSRDSYKEFVSKDDAELFLSQQMEEYPSDYEGMAFMVIELLIVKP